MGFVGIPREPSAVWHAAHTVAERVDPLAGSGLAGPFASSASTGLANSAARATTYKDFISTNPSGVILDGANPPILQCTMTEAKRTRKPSPPRAVPAPVYKRAVVVSAAAKEGRPWRP